MSESSGTAVSNKLSHSAARLYSECGMKYNFHYNERLRERTKSGALLFGSAWDEYVQEELKAHFIRKEAIADPEALFDSIWAKGEINGTEYDLPECELIGYGASDFDYELLKQDDIKFLEAKILELEPSLLAETEIEDEEGNKKVSKPTLEEVYKKLAEYKKLKDNKKRPWQGKELRLFNLYNWFSMRRKGHLMAKAHREHIIPRIKEVKSIQKVGELKNDNNDTVISYLDLECIWEDGRHCILDYKTSASEYDDDAVLMSQQLTIYGYTHSIEYGGFLVFKKQIKKNRVKVCETCKHDGIKENGKLTTAKTCDKSINGKRCGGKWNQYIEPECEVQILIDRIPERTKEIVMESIDSINNGITNKIFTRNFNACKQGYGKCPYFNLCFKNDKSDLVKV